MLKRVIALEYKRKFICLLGAAALVMILAACAGSLTAAPKVSRFLPDWFGSCPGKKYKSEICGSGTGKTPLAAENEAIQQIARRINTNSYNKQICKTSTQSTTGSVSVDDYCNEISSIEASHNFSDLQKLKSECPPQENMCYVMMKWDMATVATKAIRLLQNLGDACVPGNTKSLLYTSNFAKDIQKDIRCQSSWRLERNHGKWYVNIGRNFKPILILHSELANFFPRAHSEYLHLSLSSNDIYHGDGYSLEVENEKEGFLYIFMVNKYGQVLSLPVTSKEEITPPATRHFPPDGYEMESVAPHGVEGSFRDFFIAALCEKPIEIEEFSEIGQQDNLSFNDEDSYNMDRLFDKLEYCESSTEILRQKRK